jgi:hypothetical protein
MTNPTLPPTVVIVSAYAGDDYFNETKRGYSEDDAFVNICEGRFEGVEQVLLISETGCEDITTRLSERVADYLDDCRRDNWGASTSAAEFAERFGGYVPGLTRAEIAANRADYINDCRKDDCHPLVEAFTE